MSNLVITAHLAFLVPFSMKELLSQDRVESRSERGVSDKSSDCIHMENYLSLSGLSASNSSFFGRRITKFKEEYVFI